MQTELLTRADIIGPLISPDRTALVIIDVQNDFAAPDGAAGSWGIDLAPVEAAIDQMEPIVARAREVGAAVYFVKVETTPETDSRALKQYFALSGQPPEAMAICRAGTPGADFYRILPQNGDLQITKRLFSAFVGTDFESQLRSQGIDTLLLIGMTTECCIDCTARDAFHRDFSVFIVADATAAYDGALHQSSLCILSKNCASITDAETVLSCWNAPI